MESRSYSVGEGRLLLAAAAPAEVRAIAGALGLDIGPADRPWTRIELSRRIDLVATGIGKANAAGAVARVLDPSRHSAVLSVGVAGALPGSGLRPGAVVLASACAYADEGLSTPEGFLTCDQIGFPLGDFSGSAVPVHPAIADRYRQLADAFGPIATVSTCSGTDALAQQVEARTGALAEAMEGAAVAQVALRLGVPAGELRAISNTTGDRARQVWDLSAALAALARVLGRVGAGG